MKKILIVEDEDNIREYMIEALELSGYEAVGARNGAEALDQLEGVALIYTDLKMPDMTGYDLLERISHTHPEIPVVVVSAQSVGDASKRALDLGARDFMTKPIKLSVLLARTRDLLS